MKKTITLAITSVIFLFLFNIAIAAEKPVTVKGISLGMNIDDAKSKLTKILNKEWVITKIGDTDNVLADCRFGNEIIFNKGSKTIETLDISYGDYGFAVHRYNFYEGYISADKSTKRITRISLSGELINDIYAIKKIDGQEFLNQFTKYYNLPEFSWIAYGWKYTSPLGYTIIFMTNKLLDIKKDSAAETLAASKPKIDFE